MYSGTIKPDGSVTMHGCVPTKTRLVAISAHMIAIHHPGGTYWDNGGEHYVRSWVQVAELDDLRRSNEPDTWVFEIKHTGPGLSYHPTIKHAVNEAVDRLVLNGDRWVQLIEKEKLTITKINH